MNMLVELVFIIVNNTQKRSQNKESGMTTYYTRFVT